MGFALVPHNVGMFLKQKIKRIACYRKKRLYPSIKHFLLLTKLSLLESHVDLEQSSCMLCYFYLSQTRRSGLGYGKWYSRHQQTRFMFPFVVCSAAFLQQMTSSLWISAKWISEEAPQRCFQAALKLGETWQHSRPEGYIMTLLLLNKLWAWRRI